MTGEVDQSALADFALRLVARPSPSGQEGDVAQLVGDEMRRLGYEVDVDALGNVTGTLERGEGQCVLFDSHMDTVGVTNPAAWARDPGGQLADNIANRADDAFIDSLAAPTTGQPIAYVPFFPLGGFTPLQSSALEDAAIRIGI